MQRDLFGHKSGSIFPKLLCSVSVREGEGYEKQGRVQLTMKVLLREDLPQADLLRESMVLGFGENSKLTDNIYYTLRLFGSTGPYVASFQCNCEELNFRCLRGKPHFGQMLRVQQEAGPGLLNVVL